MASFNPAVEKVLSIEGGYQNDPADWGNYNAYTSDGQYVEYKNRKGHTLRAGTNRGISAGLYSGLLKREVSEAEMKAITVSQAIDILETVYWDKMQGDEIPNQALAELILDGHVNHGTSGLMLVQRVLNRMGANLAEDGVVGPKTLQAINTANVAQLYNGILEARRQLYYNLVQSRPDNQKFLQGWLNRLAKFPAMALKAVKENPGISAGSGLLLIALIWFLSSEK